MSQYLLSILIWLPILGGFVLLAIGDEGDVKSSRAGMMRNVRKLVVAIGDRLQQRHVVAWLIELFAQQKSSIRTSTDFIILMHPRATGYAEGSQSIEHD